MPFHQKIVHIIYRRGRTMTLAIKHGEVVVRAPLRTSRQLIEKFVDQHRTWIQDQLSRHAARSGTIFWLGERYLLTRGTTRRLRLHQHQLILPPNADYKTLLQWFCRQARNVISDRLLEWCTALRLSPPPLRITQAQTRWGSCSRQNLSFSLFLVGAPLAVIDYVIVHELVHLSHPHHQASFWQKVAQHYPDHQTARRWLRQHGAELHFSATHLPPASPA